MKTTVLFLFILLGFSLSCSNDFEAKPAQIQPKEKWYLKIGLDYVSTGEVLSGKVKEIIAENKFDFTGNYAKETYHYHGGVVSHIVASESNPDEYLIVNKISKSEYNVVKMNVSGQDVTYIQNNNVIATLDLNTKKLSTGAKTNVEYPGNCSELGPKRTNEDFGECFARNFDNFCCDFTGCAAIIAMPTAVGTAIAISCSGAFPEE